MSEWSGAGVRAIDHVGVTVPDIEEAARFFAEALGAEPLYEMTPSKPATDDNLRLEQAQLGTRPGTRWRRALMMRLGDGPCIELFDYEDPDRRPAVTATDLGVQHFAIYVDDIDAVKDRMVAAGATALEGPSPLNGPEAGEGNQWLYVQAPWGGLIELVTYPSSQPWEQTTSLRRWKAVEAEEPTADRKEQQ
ncbi:MAG TPA: VOC family protein [Gaiella sp.]|jgi:catechol 2,3-dioxygenase-like lactoylglutathione lyase family enzyme|nr:VOC family protein [Gaiella sp.]